MKPCLQNVEIGTEYLDEILLQTKGEINTSSERRTILTSYEFFLRVLLKSVYLLESSKLNR